jgi:hypothetical protein
MNFLIYFIYPEAFSPTYFVTIHSRVENWSKVQCHEIFASGVFHELSSPKPMKITLGLLEFFSKFAEIFTSQGTPLVSTTPKANLPPVSNTPVTKFPPVSMSPVANLPPVSTTSGK